MREREDISEEKIREWLEFVEKHGPVFKKITRKLK